MSIRNYIITAAMSGKTKWTDVSIDGALRYNYALGLEITGTGLVDVEFHLDLNFRETGTGAPVIYTHDVLKDIICSKSSHMVGPVIAVRLNVKSLKQGTVKLRIIQS